MGLSDARGEELRSRFATVERDVGFPNVWPRDAATLVIVDRSGRQPKVLMGKRHHGLKFMAGKFVFPGGRIEPDDRRMPTGSELDPPVARLLRAGGWRREWPEARPVQLVRRRGRWLNDRHDAIIDNQVVYLKIVVASDGDIAQLRAAMA